MIEAPFALLEIEMEVLAWDAIKASQMTLCLVPEVLDPVDVVPVMNKRLGMIDVDMMELRNVEHIMGAKAVSVDDTVRLDLFLDDREKRC